MKKCIYCQQYCIFISDGYDYTWHRCAECYVEYKYQDNMINKKSCSQLTLTNIHCKLDGIDYIFCYDHVEKHIRFLAINGLFSREGVIILSYDCNITPKNASSKIKAIKMLS